MIKSIIMESIDSVIFQGSVSENYTTINFSEELISGLLDSYSLWQFTIEISSDIEQAKGKFVKSPNVEECFVKMNTTTDASLKLMYTLEFIGMRNPVVADKIEEILGNLKLGEIYDK